MQHIDCVIREKMHRDRHIFKESQDSPTLSKETAKDEQTNFFRKKKRKEKGIKLALIPQSRNTCKSLNIDEVVPIQQRTKEEIFTYGSCE